MAKSKQPACTPDSEPAAPAEGYTVLARRYRPRTFSEIVGQEAVARALANALKSNRVAHAYLFTGARGVGKTSTARILAKALNCEKGPTDTPCGVCDMCRSIAGGEDVDVLEIDGASNNSVEDIRELRQNVQYRPSRGRYRIYIIDEVHMLAASAHKSAFNALLKTLEEPPPHVKFIFATTEVQKIPATILSRCQRFDFAAIPLARIIERLRFIIDNEHLQAEDDALEVVARRAGGSLRDAQSLLDQLLAFGGDRLTVGQVHQLLGTAGDEGIVGLADVVIGGDAKKALDMVEEVVASGLQLGEFVDQLIAYWRDLMVVNAGGIEGRELSVPSRHHETLAKQARAVGLDTILAGLDVLSATKARLRGSNHGRTLVELALVRLSCLGDLVSLAQVAQWLGQARGGPNQAAKPAPSAQLPESLKKKSAPPAPEPVDEPAPRPLTEETLPQLWPKILSKVGSLLARDLEKANLPAIFGPNTLVIRFPSIYNHAVEHCQASSSVSRLEDALRKVTGRTWNLRFETTPTPVPNAPLPSPGEAEAVRVARPRRDFREEAEKQPLVRRAKEALGGQVIRADEGFGELAAPPAPAGPTEEEEP
jgi:DNA polymerase-3 subunit gamma/tau